MGAVWGLPASREAVFPVSLEYPASVANTGAKQVVVIAVVMRVPLASAVCVT